MRKVPIHYYKFISYHKKINIVINQKQHLQSIGQSGVLPPFPIFSSYSVYIFTPPSTFFVDGISPSFAARSFCSIFHCFFSFKASFFYSCYFLASVDDFSRVSSAFD
jgi:hypothetical protein